MFYIYDGILALCDKGNFTYVEIKGVFNTPCILKNWSKIMKCDMHKKWCNYKVEN